MQQVTVLVGPVSYKPGAFAACAAVSNNSYCYAIMHELRVYLKFGFRWMTSLTVLFFATVTKHRQPSPRQHWKDPQWAWCEEGR